MFKLLNLVFFIFGTTCLCHGYDLPDPYKTHPYFVSIESDGLHVCSGTILDELYVISTQTCVSSRPLRSLAVRAGTSKRGRRGFWVKVKRVVPFPSTSTWTQADDLALLEIDSPFEYSQKIMWLNPNIDGIEENQNGKIAAWKNSKLTPFAVRVLPNADCSAAFAGVLEITDGMFCAVSVDPSGQLCLVSSGAAMYDNEQIFGLVTQVPDCGQSELPLIVSSVADREKSNFFLSTCANYTEHYM